MTLAISLMLSAPFLYVGIHNWFTGIPLFSFFFVGTMFIAALNGPLSAVMHDILPKGVRATAFATYLLIIHLLGEATAPAIVGKISDVVNLKIGMEMLTYVAFIGGVCFLPVSWLIYRKKVIIYEDNGAIDHGEPI